MDQVESRSARWIGSKYNFPMKNIQKLIKTSARVVSWGILAKKNIFRVKEISGQMSRNWAWDRAFTNIIADLVS